MKKKEKRKLRDKIAKRVSLKMMYMNVCPNERDCIINIILPKEYRFPWHTHCDTDCNHHDCEVKKWMTKHQEEKTHDN